MRYFLELSYLGKAYNGWQIQPNAPSVQETLQRALSTLLRTPTGVVGAGRTDTGVHAAFYVAHFDVGESLADPQRFCYHLNAILPADIAVQRVRRVNDEAHARFDATEREYKYYVSPRKDPFTRDVTYQLIMPLDLEKMNRAARTLLGEQLFTSFSKLHSGNKTDLCCVTKAEWNEVDGRYVFTIADSFLPNMVRAIVGTLIEVGRGKRSVEEFQAIIAGRDRALAGTSAPPQGLFLTRVDYPAEIYKD